MKNIHLLPTDKPSRLRYNLSNILVLTKEAYRDYRKQVNQNIYITSDEKFVRDEYITDGIEAIKASPKLVDAQGLVTRRNWRKIILTTDTDLIKDGVQAIDDEFLEWFVKNPSYEWVEIREGFANGTSYGYKIIIPKEEPKQRLEKYSERFDNKENEVVEGIFDSENWGNRIVKQETLTNDTDSHSWGFENFEVIKTEEDAKIFVETMENIPEPNDKLKKAFKDFNKQETFKQDTLNPFLSTSNVIVKDSQKFDYKNIVLPKEFRQETLEEAAEKHARTMWGVYYDDIHPDISIVKTQGEISVGDFIAGAKWQQEQNKNKYSEEEVLEIIDSLFHQYASSFRIDAKEHFLQFKKK